MCLAIACGLAACTATLPEPQPTDDETVTIPEALALPPTTAQACPADQSCPAKFNLDCSEFDADCGDEFCRTPGVQCDGQPSTFIRVAHLKQCFDAAGNSCISKVQGRRLVHCGC
ncbi:MAG TPA: hypothetical protein VLM79_13475 [Kofleriaceae bacterium]|nr:hypothetical protein [Kofleriaceae bacterium]